MYPRRPLLGSNNEVSRPTASRSVSPATLLLRAFAPSGIIVEPHMYGLFTAWYIKQAMMFITQARKGVLPFQLGREFEQPDVTRKPLRGQEDFIMITSYHQGTRHQWPRSQLHKTAGYTYLMMILLLVPNSATASHQLQKHQHSPAPVHRTRKNPTSIPLLPPLRQHPK